VRMLADASIDSAKRKNLCKIKFAVTFA
jgi:hypothetical protein